MSSHNWDNELDVLGLEVDPQALQDVINAHRELDPINEPLILNEADMNDWEVSQDSNPFGIYQEAA